MTLPEFVLSLTTRGECKCGRCQDVGTAPDPDHPHTVDMVFFKVAPTGELPNLDAFIAFSHTHTAAHGDDVNPFDGKEHSYLELGGWIGDQGIAMQYMALGVMLGAFSLLSPYTMLRLPAGDPLALSMAGAGYVSIQAHVGVPA